MVEIYLNNTLCDYFSDVPTDIVLSVEAITGDTLSTSGSRAKRSVRLPYTKRNAQILQNFANTPNVEFLTHLAPLTCSILVDGLPVFNGTAKLTSANFRGTVEKIGSVITLDLVGNNADWIATAKNTPIRSLDWQVSNHRFTDIGIPAGYTAVDASTDFYCYTFIRWRETANLDYLLLDELTPCLFVRQMLQTFFNSLGFTVLSSGFWDSELCKRLIMPIAINPDTSEYSAKHTVTGVQTAPQNIGLLLGIPDFTGGQITSDESSHYNNTQLGYYLDDVGTITATLKVTMSNIVGAGGTADIGVFIGTFVPLVVGTTYSRFYAGGLGVGTFYATVEVPITDADLGQYLIPYISWGLVGTADVQCEIEYIYKKQYLMGASVQFGELIPKTWKMSDLIRGLSECFNLIFDTNSPAKTVLIDCKDNWIERDPNAQTQTVIQGYYQEAPLAMTAKQDYIREMRSVYAEQKRWYVQRYDANDPTAEALDEGQEVQAWASDGGGVYSQAYSFGQVSSIDDATTVTNSFFVKTLHVLEPNLKGDNSVITPQVPLCYGTDYLTELDPEGTYDDSPRLLYWGGQQERYGTIDIDNGGVTEIELPCSFMVFYAAGENYEPNLSYCDEVMIDGTTYVGGLSTYFFHKQLARLLRNNIYTAYFMLSPIDIINFTFARKWLIENTPYCVLTIDGYKPDRNLPTKVELWQDENTELARYWFSTLSSRKNQQGLLQNRTPI